MLFDQHKCKYEKINEVVVYNTLEVQDLYRHIHNANSMMLSGDVLNLKDRKITLHEQSFTMLLEQNDVDLFMVPVYIKGKMYRFILDTGAQMSSIASTHKELIDAYKTAIHLPIKSASGSIKEMETICIDTVFFGAVELTNQPLVVLDSERFKIPVIKHSIIEFDGIIGWDILSHLDFELDPKHNTFSVITSEEKFTYCNLIQSIFPTVIVYDKNHKPALFGIDSGAKESWLNEEYCKKNNYEFLKQKLAFGIGVLGIEKMKIQIVKEVKTSFSSALITLENTRTGDTKVFSNYALDGIYGNEIFHKHKIQFLNSKGIVKIID